MMMAGIWDLDKFAAKRYKQHLVLMKVLGEVKIIFERKHC